MYDLVFVFLFVGVEDLIGLIDVVIDGFVCVVFCDFDGDVEWFFVEWVGECCFFD